MERGVTLSPLTAFFYVLAVFSFKFHVFYLGTREGEGG